MAARATIMAVYEDNSDGTIRAKLYNDSGSLVRTLSLAYVDTWSFHHICADKSGNFYFTGYEAGAGLHTMWKIDNEGNILATTTTLWDWTDSHIAMGSDGYVYIYNTHDNTLDKRDPDTLAVVDTGALDNAEDLSGLAFYSETGFLVGNMVEDRLEKWDFVSGFIESRDFAALSFQDSALGVSNDIVLGIREHLYAWTIPVSFDEDETLWYIDGIARPHGGGAVLHSGDFLVIGEETNGGGVIIGRYTTAKELVWQVAVTEAGYHPVEIAAYPFEDVVVVGDYPLAPVTFLAQPTKLEDMCSTFGRGLCCVGLAVNHNTVITRRYLQEVYGDVTYPESSNLRSILPHPQLTKLSSEGLTLKDYKGIINNFISNVSDLFVTINQNNTTIKAWLDDYEPDEEGHEFTDVKMEHIVMGEESNLDELVKVMDYLFKLMKDNVTVLNMNLEVLKERF